MHMTEEMQGTSVLALYLPDLSSQAGRHLGEPSSKTIEKENCTRFHTLNKILIIRDKSSVASYTCVT